MPTAELLSPRRYNILGRIWERGIEVEVDDEVARELEDNPRFKVRTLSRRQAVAEEDAPAPKVVTKVVKKDAAKERVDQIREAMDDLDPDVEEAYDDHGKPNPEHLTEVLGFEVTQEDVDGILGVKTKPKPEPAKMAKPEPDKSKVKLTRKPAPAPEPAPDKDPTTDDALDVS